MGPAQKSNTEKTENVARLNTCRQAGKAARASAVIALSCMLFSTSIRPTGLFMPPISAQLHEEIGKRLRKSREDMIATVRARTDAPPDEQPSIAPGPHIGQAVDAPTGEMIAHTEEHFAEHESNMLHEIDVALGRLESGGYGICVSCGRDIPEDRLLATPTVQTCVQCQERIEQERHTGRGPTM
jgi:RNA polymerase-binding transcription factor DksA